jgi:hypothetical protein
MDAQYPKEQPFNSHAYFNNRTSTKSSRSLLYTFSQCLLEGDPKCFEVILSTTFTDASKEFRVLFDDAVQKVEK